MVHRVELFHKDARAGYRPISGRAAIKASPGSTTPVAGETYVETDPFIVTMYKPPKQKRNDPEVFITSQWKLKTGGQEYDVVTAYESPLQKEGFGLSRFMDVSIVKRK